MKIILATRNKHKIHEIRQILEHPGLEIVTIDHPSLAGLGPAPPVEEDGLTFSENARKKALALARWSGLPALADDSGLAVDALGGRPGVQSSRFAGKNGDDAANNAKLLREMKDVPEGKRTARFLCVLSLAAEDGRTWEAEGAVEGVILRELRGTGGFGYDPLFFCPDLGATFGEAPAGDKNRVSHRSRALARLAEQLPEIEKELLLAPGISPSAESQ